MNLDPNKEEEEREEMFSNLPGRGVALQVTRCIERALRRYGETTASVVMWNFESLFKVHKDEILRYPDEFVQSLEKMFGVGYSVIEGIILKEFKSYLPGLITDGDSQDLAAALKQIQAYDESETTRKKDGVRKDSTGR